MATPARLATGRVHQRLEDLRNAEKLSEQNLSLSNEITMSQKEVFLVLADYIDRRALDPVMVATILKNITDIKSFITKIEAE